MSVIVRVPHSCAKQKEPEDAARRMLRVLLHLLPLPLPLRAQDLRPETLSVHTRLLVTWRKIFSNNLGFFYAEFTCQPGSRTRNRRSLQRNVNIFQTRGFFCREPAAAGAVAQHAGVAACGLLDVPRGLVARPGSWPCRGVAGGRQGAPLPPSSQELRLGRALAAETKQPSIPPR